MSERKGSISVQTADIFPIIKKWLYSEHDIFIRELVANATDAITKRSTLGRTRNVEVPAGRVEIKVDDKLNTITITDNGLGMTESEVEKYIAQLAFSGAEEFVKKMEQNGEKNNDIIGKFGLGFYSAFMVANKVEVDSLSMEDGAKATKWICEGDTDYTFTESSKTDVGTTITLHIAEDSKEFLSEFKLSTTLKNHCDFMPYPIVLINVNEKLEEGKELTQQQINDTNPIWKKDPSELKDEDYKNFYQKMFPMDGDPLFWIHLKVDHPFTLDGVLFFPKFNPTKPMTDRNIRLYCKQVFVSDNVKNIMPDFLGLLKGTVDSVDIPLNVSRSSLQGDPNISKISNYIVKKVAEALKKLWIKDRPRYEEIWEDIHLFIKYGCVSDPKFDELMRERVLFKNSAGKFMTLTEYKESIPAEYKEKLGDKVIYFEKEKSDNSLRKELLSVGVQTLEVDDHIDPHFMQHAETKKVGEHNVQFTSVDAEIANILESENTNEEDMKIKDLFISILAPKKEGEEAKMDDTEIEIAKIKNSHSPAYFKVDEQMKRFSKMAQSMGGGMSFPIKKTLVVNPLNPLVRNALKIHESGKNEALVEKLCKHVEDMATISSEGLKAEQKDLFIERTQSLMQELTSIALQ
ncbi:Hsp90 protein [Bacteriovorax sp. BSW11_IV]|uniref:molecular chaperone HtpG n=1 Tax=Bacteriovorax sp. BSW11_IV TaxID=1353529 RepID=UPI00038A1172|nr:molecular chaperone HtpG [Bacteriovorax sp. BSW11_IV]EQC44618.1 Hsp90 protein [Bacteriovorax sp. BSW11_IV]